MAKSGLPKFDDKTEKKKVIIFLIFIFNFLNWRQQQSDLLQTYFDGHQTPNLENV